MRPSRKLVVLLSLLTFAASFAGILPVAYYEVRTFVRRGRQEPIGRRYAQLIPVLPADAYLGYLDDTSGEERIRMLQQAQYALAPHVLVSADETEARFIVANLKDPHALGMILRERELTVVESYPDGLALLRKNGR